MNIEPGCLAVVTNSCIPENIGMVVGVIRKADPPDIVANSIPGDVFWELDTPLVRSNFIGERTKNNFHIERWLMRIDGHTEPEEVDTAISNLYEEI